MSDRIKKCTKCPRRAVGEDAIREMFYKNKDYSGGYTAWCKTCYREYRRENDQRKKNRFYSDPHVCGSCKTKQGNIIGDKSTGTVYGYLCSKCTNILSASSGDVKRLRDVTAYINKTRRAK